MIIGLLDKDLTFSYELLQQTFIERKISMCEMLEIQ